MSIAELDDVTEAVRLAAKVDYAALPAAERTAAVEQLTALAARVAGVQALAVRAWDASLDWSADAYRSPAAALKHRSRMYGGEAAGVVALSRKLVAMALSEQALLAGEITVHHARRLTRAATRPEFGKAESFLLEKAAQLSFADFDRAVTYWEQVVDENRTGDPDPPDPREDDRTAHVSKTLKGQRRVDGWLDPVGGAEFAEVLRRIEKELFDADWQLAKQTHGDDTSADLLWRTPGQRRADALVEMARRAATAPADGKRPRPLLIIHSDHATFEMVLASLAGSPHPHLDPYAQRLCELDDGTVISPTQMLEQAIIGDVRRLVYEAPGVILDYGRKVRLFEGALREAIVARDRRCDHEGCDIPARWCEIDHTVEFERGGPTSHRNGRAKCSFHHRRWKPGPG